jgi:hypothetical protein
VDSLKRLYGLRDVFCWHGLSLYWSGVSTEEEAVAKYGSRLVFSEVRCCCARVHACPLLLLHGERMPVWRRLASYHRVAGSDEGMQLLRVAAAQHARMPPWIELLFRGCPCGEGRPPLHGGVVNEGVQNSPSGCQAWWGPPQSPCGALDHA